MWQFRINKYLCVILTLSDEKGNTFSEGTERWNKSAEKEKARGLEMSVDKVRHVYKDDMHAGAKQ